MGPGKKQPPACSLSFLFISPKKGLDRKTRTFFWVLRITKEKGDDDDDDDAIKFRLVQFLTLPYESLVYYTPCHPR